MYLNIKNMCWYIMCWYTYAQASDYAQHIEGRLYDLGALASSHASNFQLPKVLDSNFQETRALDSIHQNSIQLPTSKFQNFQIPKLPIILLDSIFQNIILFFYVIFQYYLLKINSKFISNKSLQISIRFI